MVEAGASPDGRRVVLVPNREIAALLNTLALRSRAKIRIHRNDPVGRIEKLRGLENHFDNMLITMPARTTRCLVRKIKDVHFRADLRVGAAFNFCLTYLPYMLDSRYPDFSSALHPCACQGSAQTLDLVHRLHQEVSLVSRA